MSHPGVQAAPPPLRAVLPPWLRRAASHPLTIIAALFAASRLMLVLVGMLTFRQLRPESDRWREGVAALLCRRTAAGTPASRHGYRADSSATQPARRRSRSSGLPAADRSGAGVYRTQPRGRGRHRVEPRLFGALVYVHRYAVLLGRAAVPGSTVGFVTVALLKAAYFQAGSPVFDGGAPTVAA